LSKAHQPAIDQLIQAFSRLPGLGPRSSRRLVLYLLKHKESRMLALVDALEAVAGSIRECETCGNLDTQSPCAVCTDPRRDTSILCVVETVADLWALDRTESFRGLYHVLGGTLSAIDGVGPEDLAIGRLMDRVKAGTVKEVILATNATVDGQTTAHYIAAELQERGIPVTGIAHGVPVGGELDYLDDGTLMAAMRARKPVD